MAIITNVSIQNCTKTKTVHKANIASIIAKSVDGSTHVVSRVKQKIVNFHKKLHCTVSINGSKVVLSMLASAKLVKL